jgi:hypothetical protein
MGGIERLEIHLLNRVDHEPREVPFRQPLADVGRQQKRLLTITRDESLRHRGILFNRPDESTVLPPSSVLDNGPVTEFAKGQYVELYPTIPSSRGASLRGGTRGIVQAIDPTRDEDEIYLVEFLAAEKPTGEHPWLRAIDLSPA